MKTLDNLKPGDDFFLIYVSYDCDCITDVKKHTVSIVREIQIGKIIKWLDKDGNMFGTTITKEEYNDVMCKAFYQCKICSDKEYVFKLIKEDKEKQIKRYNQMLDSLE